MHSFVRHDYCIEGTTKYKVEAFGHVELATSWGQTCRTRGRPGAGGALLRSSRSRQRGDVALPPSAYLHPNLAHTRLRIHPPSGMCSKPHPFPVSSTEAVPVRPPAQADARGALPSASFVSGQHPAASRKQRTFSDPFLAARCRAVSPPKLSAAAKRFAPALASKHRSKKYADEKKTETDRHQERVVAMCFVCK